MTYVDRRLQNENEPDIFWALEWYYDALASVIEDITYLDQIASDKLTVRYLQQQRCSGCSI